MGPLARRKPAALAATEHLTHLQSAPIDAFERTSTSTGRWCDGVGEFIVGIGDAVSDWWDSSVVEAGVGGFGEGLWHGFLMVLNQATFELITPLDDYVDRLKAQHGRLYEAADWFAFIGVNAAYAALIPNLGTWAKNPAMYELGSTTLTSRLFVSLEHLTPIERGQAIYRQLGWRGFGLSRLATWADWAQTLPQGATPGGWLAILSGADLADETIDCITNHWQN